MSNKCAKITSTKRFFSIILIFSYNLSKEILFCVRLYVKKIVNADIFIFFLIKLK